MWAAVRRYEGITDPAEAGRLVGESFIPQPGDIPCFVAYYWIDAGDGIMASLSVFEDQTGADKSVERMTGCARTRPSSFRSRRR